MGDFVLIFYIRTLKIKKANLTMIEKGDGYGWWTVKRLEIDWEEYRSD